MKRSRIRFADHFRVKHGYAFKSEYFADEGPFALLTPGNFNEAGGFRNRGDKQPYYIGDVPPAYILAKGDVIIAMTEQDYGLLGSSVWVPASEYYLHNQRLGLIVDLNEKRLNKRFLYYLFNTREVRHQIAGSASGTKVRHTAPERIGRVEAEIPDIKTQERIADTLTAYDDLMENNRRRMALLEESARLLYREWFVHLRFPGHEHTRLTDGVPQGWERKVLSDICTDVRESVSPEEVEANTPYIGLEHIPRRSISLTDWGTVETVTSSKNRFVAGDILFGKIRPYFHKVGIAFTDGVASSDAIVIRPHEERHLALTLMTVSGDDFVAEASQSAREGSKMPRADWKLMLKYPVLIPSKALLTTFSGAVNDVTAQLKNLCFQTQKLRTARDLLLPRLMSGEIAV